MFEPNEQDEQAFEDFLASIQLFADEMGLPVSYIEDEFVIDGELVKG